MRWVKVPPETASLSTEPLTIVFLVSTLRRTGPTSQLLNIIRYLDRERFCPAVVTLSGEPEDSMLRMFQQENARISSAAMSRARGLLHRAWRSDIIRLAGVIPGSRCVVHSQGVRADTISARWLGDIPRLATARNDPYNDYVLKYGRLAGSWMASSQIRAMGKLTAVVACSSTLAVRLRGHGLEPLVIRNGVDTENFRPPDLSERAAARARLEIAPGTHVGVCVGSLVARKDPVAVVRAVRALNSPNLTMFFVGTGKLEGAIREAARGDPRIRFAGQSDAVRLYLHAADFLVSSSRSEGLPNSVLEALACGLPVLLSDIAPHAELLEIAPGSGMLYRLGDETALVNCIRGAIGGSGLGAGLSPAQARVSFGAETMSRNYQDLYRALAGSRR